MIAIAEVAIAAYVRYLAPADDADWLTARINALLHHGWLERTDPATFRVIIGDWINELRAFPQWAIANAAASLLRTPGRIGLAQMAQACRDEVGDARLELAALRRLVDPEEQRAAWQRLEERRNGRR